MATQEVTEYIKQALKMNISNKTIRENLVEAGWQQQDIDAGMEQVLPVPLAPGKKALTKLPGGNPTLWDAFEHILMFISMYVLAITLGLTLVLFVDKWAPGTPDGYSNADAPWRLSTLRGYIASLLVAYPLFSFFFLRITKRTLDNPRIRALSARKFLIYLTLVVAFIVVIGNIIGLIFNFLSGNITVNFLLKFMVIITISGTVFTYYLNQVKEDRQTYA